MAPNDTTTGNSRYNVPDQTTTSNDTLTSDAAGHIYKTSGGEVDPGSLVSKKPSSDPPSNQSPSSDSSSSDSTSSDSSSSGPHFSGGDDYGGDDYGGDDYGGDDYGGGDYGGDSGDDGGIVDTVLDVLSSFFGN